MYLRIFNPCRKWEMAYGASINHTETSLTSGVDMASWVRVARFTTLRCQFELACFLRAIYSDRHVGFDPIKVFQHGSFKRATGVVRVE